MKFSTRRGFSLIELMISIAILAILVAVAIPAYQSYTTRSIISGEVIPLLKKATVDATEYYSVNGSLTGFCSSSQGLAFNSIDNQYLSSLICWTGNPVGAFNLQAQLDGTKFVDDVPNGGMVVFFATASGGSLKWHCGTHSASWLKVPERFLPSACRNNYIDVSGTGFVDGVDASSTSLSE